MFWRMAGLSTASPKNEMNTEDANDDGKRKYEAVNSDCNTESGKPVKRVRFQRPNRHYILGENRRILSDLLGKLLREHNWKEASGVLSTLMRGTSLNSLPVLTRKKFWAAMEILSRNASTRLNPTKIKNIYDIWASKDACSKSLNKKRYLIQLEFVLYSLMQGNIEEAHNNIRFLLQERESGSDPIVNLMGGLIFYQLWYSGLPEEMQLRDSDAHMSSDMNGMDSKVGLCVDPEQDECSADHNAVDVHNMECDAQPASDISINNSPAEQFHQDSVESYMKQSAEIHEHEVNPDNSFIDTSIYFPYGLDTSLVPVQVDHSMLDEYSVYLQKEISKEYHANAVKLLRRALHSTPPVLAALIPLIQILLLGDQVDEALKELEEFCGSLNTVLPFRLRASLLECVGLKQPTELSLSYEDVLKKDPTCSHSLAGLIRLYRNGNYDAESLLEMISLHLDATHASSGVWGELASCLLKLQMMSLSEEDRMSTVQCINGNESKHACSFPPHAIPKMFMRSEVRKSWRLRCRWWSARHFCKGIYLSEVEEGDWQLLTFKAACASHLYEPKFEYAERVHCDLKDKEDIERYSFLQMHFQNSMKLLDNLNRIR